MDNFVVDVEHIGGDMFTSILNGDAIFIKLLKNYYEALSDYGKVIGVELIAPTSVETNVATKGILQMEMFMSNLNLYGKERIKEELTTLAVEAGFSGIIIITLLILAGIKFTVWVASLYC
ncbi:caffeic acid 3-O-methyltransferase-like [Macadamia integrifolia]|uniref:caffeic acid 3-O-methyltransferase-like n=1 Tax=Macadamia integrifolia TaxID=60698 RepID=UPI001C4E809C|nr:caffeic acid 3-O-methyltransferase-like [Macadamia integrifolia]